MLNILSSSLNNNTPNRSRSGAKLTATFALLACLVACGDSNEQDNKGAGALIDNAKDKVESLDGDGMFENAGEAMDNGLDSVADGVKETANNAMSTAKKSSTELMDATKEQTQEALAAAKKSGSNALDTAKSSGEDLVGQARSKADQLGEDLSEKAKLAKDKLAD